MLRRKPQNSDISSFLFNFSQFHSQLILLVQTKPTTAKLNDM